MWYTVTVVANEYSETVKQTNGGLTSNSWVFSFYTTNAMSLLAS